MWDDGVPIHLTREMQDGAIVDIGRPESVGLERSAGVDVAENPELSDEEIEEIDLQYEEEYPRPQPQQQRESKSRLGGKGQRKGGGKKGGKGSMHGFHRQFSAYGGGQ